MDTHLKLGSMVWVSKLPTNGFTRLGLKSQVEVHDGLQGVIWHQDEACVDANQNHEELVSVKCIYIYLNHFACGG